MREEEKRRLQRLRGAYESIQAPPELEERLAKTLRKKRVKPAVLWMRRLGGCAAAAVLVLTITANVSAEAAQFLEGIPVIGAFTKIVTIRNYTDRQENMEAKIETPRVSGLTYKELEEELNSRFQEYADQLIARYKRDQEETGGQGRESLTSTYQVLADDERKLSIMLETSVSMAGTQVERVYYTLDKETGEILTLKDLFQEGADYITPISAELRRQMKEQMKQDENFFYFLMEDEGFGFDKIKPDQQFTVDAQGRLLISFDKYEVAPGAMGALTFTIPYDVVEEILRPNSLVTE